MGVLDEILTRVSIAEREPTRQIVERVAPLREEIERLDQYDKYFAEHWDEESGTTKNAVIALEARDRRIRELLEETVELRGTIEARDRNILDLKRTVGQLTEIAREFADRLLANNPALRKAQWPWPVTEVEPGHGGAHTNFANQQSALKRCGYRVGNTDPMSQVERIYFLDYFLANRLPANVENTPGEYGDPGTAKRLQRMATVIAAICRSRKRRRDAANFAQAIADWESDLSYLRDKYYEGKGPAGYPLKFQSPTTGEVVSTSWAWSNTDV